MTAGRFIRAAAGAASIATLIALGACAPLYGASDSAPVAAPVIDNPKAPGSMQTAVIAAGCFWGVQGVFEHVRGVQRAVSGYSGGSKRTAEYETVSGGMTGHAESVMITFDPAQISYGQILQIAFSVVHDPTELNRQGPDVGTQYRSAIFYADPGQRRIAESYIAQLNQAARLFAADRHSSDAARWASIRRRDIIRITWFTIRPRHT